MILMADTTTAVGQALAIKRAACIVEIQGVSNTKGGEAARDESKEIRGGPESISADTGSERPGRVREMRNETSECEVRAALT